MSMFIFLSVVALDMPVVRPIRAVRTILEVESAENRVITLPRDEINQELDC